MNKLSAVVLSFVFAGSSLAGCSAKPVAQNATQVIEQSKTQGTVEAQSQFLLDQGKALLASKNYEEAVNIANYIVANFKDKAPEAQKLLQDAQAKLKAALQEKLGAVEKDVNAAATDLNKKIGSFGK